MFLTGVFLVNFFATKDVKTDKNLPKIGVLSIATGRYSVFWKGFYKSSEKYFLPGYEKEYFLFTDDLNVPYKNKKNVNVIYTKHQSWPFPTLLRYEIFLTQKEKLQKLDYLYYFNMNLVFRDYLKDEVLPKKEDDRLVFVEHCWLHSAPSSKFPYERNPNSQAYVPFGKEGKNYVPGGFLGGGSKEFIEYSEYCAKNIRKDLEKGIIARWHDESYSNKYIIDKSPLILPSEYMYVPKCSNKEYEKIAKTAHIDKQKYGGRTYLRGQSNIKSTRFSRLKYLLLSKYAFTKEKRDLYYSIYNKLLY